MGRKRAEGAIKTAVVRIYENDAEQLKLLATYSKTTVADVLTKVMERLPRLQISVNKDQPGDSHGVN